MPAVRSVQSTGRKYVCPHTVLQCSPLFARRVAECRGTGKPTNTKILFPRNRDAGISYCRLLLHDTMLREDSFRTGVSDTPMCKCGMEHESAEHFLFRCAEHHSARSVMIDDINMILSTSAVVDFLVPHLCFSSCHHW